MVHVRGTAKIIALIATLALAACTKPQDKGASVTVRLPHHANASKVAATATGPLVPWNAGITPSANTDLNCFGVFVGGSESAFKVNHMTREDGATPFYFGPWAAVRPGNSELTVKIEPGTSRTLFLVGWQVSDLAACHDLKGVAPAYGSMSKPYLIGSRTVAIEPGANTISITASLTNAIALKTFVGADFVKPPTASPTPVPGLTMTIDSGALYTTSTSVMLSFMNHNNLFDQVFIGTTAAHCNATPTWTTHNTSTSLAYILASSNAQNTVHARLRSSTTGVESTCINAVITHDSTAPATPAITVATPTTTLAETPLVTVTGIETGSTAEIKLTDSTGGTDLVGWSTYSPPAKFVYTLTGGTQYRVYARVTDAAGNSSTLAFGTFTAVAPVTATLSGMPVSPSNTTAIAVNVAGSGVTHYKYALGINLVCSAASYSASTVVTTSINTTITGDGTYVLCVIGSGDNVNWQPASSATNATWAHDSTPPTSVSMTITGTAGNTSFTTTGMVNINLSATGATEMYITNTAGCASGGTFEPIAIKNGWNLPSPNGTQSVYGFARDNAGNQSACVSATINADNTPPTITAASDSNTVTQLDAVFWNFTLSEAVQNLTADDFRNSQEPNRQTKFVYTYLGGTSHKIQVVATSHIGAGENIAPELIASSYNDQAGNFGPSHAFTPVNLNIIAPEFTKVKAGGNHSCGLIENGQLHCWGVNTQGQLGVGGTQEKKHPTPVVTTNLLPDEAFVDFGLGSSHTCGVTNKGNAYCWGAYSSGQIGDGNTTNTRFIPTKVTDSMLLLSQGERFRAIAVGTNHNCAISTLGEIYCWGMGANGRLGNGTTIQQNIPVKASFNYAANGGFRSIDSKDSHTCAVHHSGALFCWGDNTTGKLGMGASDITERNVPSAVSVAHLTALNQKFLAVSTGYNHTCAISRSGAPFCWGQNGGFELGSGNGTSYKIPNPVDLTGITTDSFQSISAGVDHTCGALTDGNIACWGGNANGQLGLGNTAAQIRPTIAFSVANDTIKQVSAGYLYTCATGVSGKAYCSGYQFYATHGTGLIANRLSPALVQNPPNLAVPQNSKFIQVRVSSTNGCALTEDGRLACWGPDTDGQIGDGPTAHSVYGWVDLTGPGPIKKFDVGTNYACAIDRLQRLWCWGDDTYGKLGNGSGVVADQNSPSMVDSTFVTESNQFIDVSLNDHTACAITGTGKVYCWGLGGAGQIGNNSSVNQERLQPVDFTAVGKADEYFYKVSVGPSHACAVSMVGEVYCWGANSAGQLADNTLINRQSPVQAAFDTATLPTAVGDRNAIDVEVGLNLTCVIPASGDPVCAGANAGIGILNRSGSTTDIDLLQYLDTANHYRYKRLTFGTTHGCGINHVGQVYCWGEKTDGRLGDNTSVYGVNSPIPVVSTDTFNDISSSAGFTCGITGAGDLRCWGQATAARPNTSNALVPSPATDGPYLSVIDND